jgi:hypothetical protein
MMKIAFSAVTIFCTAALAGVSSPALASTGQPMPAYTYARHYAKGQVSRYRYSENENGTELTAVARLRSYVHHGVGGEQVKWVALDYAGQDLNAQARAFPPYDLSLDPRDPDGLALPDTQNAGELQGPIDDLGTFYVGLSPKTGIGNLHQPGQSFVDPTLLNGNFSNATTPVGQDLIQLTTTLTSLTARQATFTSSYQPPASGGLTLTQSFMDSPVCGSTPNNFELVQQEGTAYVALWGCESFTITTIADRASGRIDSVQMTNPLQLDGVACQDEALTECASIPPTTLQRDVQLALTPNAVNGS